MVLTATSSTRLRITYNYVASEITHGDYKTSFIEWSLSDTATNSPLGDGAIVAPTTFYAKFNSELKRDTYNVTLNNISGRYTSYTYNTSTGKWSSQPIYAIESMSISGGENSPVVGNTPSGTTRIKETISDLVAYKHVATLYANEHAPIVRGRAAAPVTWTITLKDNNGH